MKFYSQLHLDFIWCLSVFCEKSHQVALFFPFPKIFVILRSQLLPYEQHIKGLLFCGSFYSFCGCQISTSITWSYTKLIYIILIKRYYVYFVFVQKSSLGGATVLFWGGGSSVLTELKQNLRGTPYVRYILSKNSLIKELGKI